MSERRRRRAAATLAALTLLVAALATSASGFAAGLRASVTATSDVAGAASRITVTVHPSSRLVRGGVRVSLPDEWPRPARSGLELSLDGCGGDAAVRLDGGDVVVSRLTCRAGATVSVSAGGRLPVTAGRYRFATTVTPGAGPGAVQAAEPALRVVPGPAHHLELTPASGSLVYGETRALRAWAVDRFGNRRAEVTDRATFTMAPDGQCSAAVCGEGAHVDPLGGQHQVTASLGELSGRAGLTVRPRHVTVAAQPATAVYGAGDPAFAYTVDGLAAGDTALDGVTCGVPGAHVGVGRYALSCRGSANPDYVVDDYRASTLEITPAPLAVAVSGIQTYGFTPAYTADLSRAGLVNGDTAAVVGGALTCRTIAGPTSEVGSYPISDCSGLSAANYTISYLPGTLQVVPRPVTVLANDQSMTAGGADPVFTYRTQPAGLTLPDVSCGVAGPHTGAGRYPITCSTTTDRNYVQTTVPGTLSVDAPPAVCGDGAVQSGEFCDDGNTVSETSCPYGNATCSACNASCSAELTLAGGYCGDTVVNGGEVCDDGNTVSETSCPYGDATCSACNASCSAPLDLAGGYCGDTVVNGGEVCDDGNNVTETSCPYGSATCSACTASCDAVLTLTGGVCGDYTKQPQEFCDDGNTVDEASCPYGSASCLTCNSSCTATLPLSGGVCGDSVQQPQEACDDGNTVTESSCPYGSVSCTACDASCTTTLSLVGPYCGDGRASGDEVCDDGNNVDETSWPDGPSCNATCTGVLSGAATRRHRHRSRGRHARSRSARRHRAPLAG